MSPIFDIVIPLGPNDVGIIETMVRHTKKNVLGYRNIYIVSFDPSLNVEGCITIDEKIFPFHLSTIARVLGNTKRNGWYLQQLLKLYSGIVIHGILDFYLVIDSDTLFLKPITFFKDDLPVYNVGDEYHIPYFQHMTKLHPSLKKKVVESGICHHMMFQREKVNHLFRMVEKYHKQPFYKSFLKCISKKDILGSGASEYEIYFNFIHIHFPNSFKIRPLKWRNTSKIEESSELVYISVHWHSRE
jgi:hypothetical protein